MKNLFLAVLAAFSISAFADVNKTCSNYASFAYSVAQARSNNVDRLQLKEQVFTMIDEGKVKQFTTNNKPELSRIIDVLYAHPEVGPEHAAQSYYVHCVNSLTDI